MIISALVFTALAEAALGEDVTPGHGFHLAYEFNRPYIYASMSDATHTLVTQRMGEFKTYSLGGGWKFDNGIFVEIGTSKVSTKENSRVWPEAVYYSFSKTFGQPPFADSWQDVNVEYEFKNDWHIRAGYKWNLWEDLDLQIAYKFHNARRYMKMWNPEEVFDGAEGGANCPCWEGYDKVNNSSIQFGLSWSW